MRLTFDQVDPELNFAEMVKFLIKVRLLWLGSLALFCLLLSENRWTKICPDEEMSLNQFIVTLKCFCFVVY